MPLIDIVTMRGMVPRVAHHLLPDEAATLAQDCHFDRGVVAPLMSDKLVGVMLPLVPQTLFHYYGDRWFAWDKLVEGDAFSHRTGSVQPGLLHRR